MGTIFRGFLAFGVTHEKAPVKRKDYSVSKKKRFSWENDAAARMGRHLARRSSRHLIDSFCSRSYSLQTLHGSLRVFLTVQRDVDEIDHFSCMDSIS